MTKLKMENISSSNHSGRIFTIYSSEKRKMISERSTDVQGEKTKKEIS